MDQGICILGGAALGGLAGHVLGHVPEKQASWTLAGVLIGGCVGYAFYVQSQRPSALGSLRQAVDAMNDPEPARERRKCKRRRREVEIVTDIIGPSGLLLESC